MGYVLAGVLLIAAFLLLGLLVTPAPSPPDAVLRTTLAGDWRGVPGDVAAVVSAVFGPVLPVLLGVALLGWAAVRWRRGDRATAGIALRVTVVLGLCRLPSLVFKPVFDRARPRAYADYAYPSGHVVSVASTGFAVVLLCLWLAPWLVRAAVAVSVAATALSAASRLVLGVHWLTDTIGAVLAVTGVGLLAATAVGLLPAVRDKVPAGRGTA
ncbi:phosphatase PAP2 family protein [Prauserella shujinwangii]|uniref:phosphatase PAP2 family protein n=1 Tax=Prauserella shujinwangii TaxID=1453103 RepID=UPI003CCBDECF